MALLASNMLMAQVPLKVKTSETEYNVEDATSITYSDNLSIQHINRQNGTELPLPMQDVREVILGDTMLNVSDYILADNDCLIYSQAFRYGYGTPHGFSCNFADPAQTNGQNVSTPGLQSRFALFVPTDAGLETFPYYISFASRTSMAISLRYTSGDYPLGAKFYSYNKETGEVKNAIGTQTMSQNVIMNFMNGLLLEHTIFFERPEDRAQGLHSGNEYFVTMAGTVVRIAPGGKSVQGAMQMDNATKGIANFSTCNIIDMHQKDNGTIYKLDSPILPPSIEKTAYSVLSGEGYEEFFKLCQEDMDVLYNLNLINTEELQRGMNAYCTFADRNGGTDLLTFLPNHPFTLYAPSNEAVRQAIADGLPTWESLAEAYGSGEVTDEAQLAEGRRKVYELMNFVRYHFHFGVEIADKLPFASRTHNTPVVLPDNGYATPQLTVSSAGNGTLTVTDSTGQVHQILDEGKNVFVRDVECNEPVVDVLNMNYRYATSYSPGVIHRINSVLRYK